MDTLNELDDLVIYKPLPICRTLASVKFPVAIISALIEPIILSAVTVVLVSNEVGSGLINPRLACTLDSL